MGGSGIAAAFEPSWVMRSERIKGEMAMLKERMGKLKECVVWPLAHASLYDRMQAGGGEGALREFDRRWCLTTASPFCVDLQHHHPTR